MTWTVQSFESRRDQLAWLPLDDLVKLGSNCLTFQFTSAPTFCGHRHRSFDQLYTEQQQVVIHVCW